MLQPTPALQPEGSTASTYRTAKAWWQVDMTVNPMKPLVLGSDMMATLEVKHPEKNWGQNKGTRACIWHICSGITFSFEFLVSICVFERQGWREKERERISTGSLLKSSQWLGLCQTKAGSQRLNSGLPYECSGPKDLSHHHVLRGCTLAGGLARSPGTLIGDGCEHPNLPPTQ